MDRSKIFDTLYGPSHILQNQSILIGYLQGSQLDPIADYRSGFSKTFFYIAQYLLYAYFAIIIMSSFLIKEDQWAIGLNFITTLQVISTLCLFKTYHPGFLDSFMKILALSLPILADLENLKMKFIPAVSSSNESPNMQRIDIF